MAAVHLNFVPPAVPNITKLHIYEAPASGGPYGLIETVTQVGAYPNYITRYTTTEATSLNDWFQIEWEDAQGALTERSNPIQGGSTTLLGEITERIMLRDPTVNETVAYQEAEAAIYQYYGADPPPADQVPPDVKSGLTYLAMARCQIASVSVAATSDVAQYESGLVSLKSGSETSSKTRDNIEWLLKMASKLLAVDTSVIGQMALASTNGNVLSYCGPGEIVSQDQSRLLVEYQ